MVKQTSAAMKPTVHRRISGTRNLPHVVAESKYKNRNITRVLSHPGLEGFQLDRY